MAKASDYNAEDLGSIPGLGRSLGEGNGNPLQYSCLVGYSPWGREELDTTEQLHFTFSDSQGPHFSSGGLSWVSAKGVALWPRA